MDEATAALDPPSQAHMMKLVNERLKESTVVSVGHRPELQAFHDRMLMLEYDPEGAKLARDEVLDHPASAPARILTNIFHREAQQKPRRAA